jgi:hypothetical protein
VAVGNSTMSRAQHRKRKYFLSPAGRASLQATIRRNLPWRRSTGPRTPMGKAEARMNALKHGERSQETIRRLRAIRATLDLLRRSKASRQPVAIDPAKLTELRVLWLG